MRMGSERERRILKKEKYSIEIQRERELKEIRTSSTPYEAYSKII